MEAALNYEVKNKLKNSKLYYTEIRNQTNTLKGRKMLPKSIALKLHNSVDRLVHAKKIFISIVFFFEYPTVELRLRCWLTVQAKIKQSPTYYILFKSCND